MHLTVYKNNKVYANDRETRLDREDCLIETLQTFYPYTLNKTKRKTNPNLPVGSSFPPIPR